MLLPPQNLLTNINTNSHTNIQINVPTKPIDLQKGPQLFLNPSELIARKSTLNKITLLDNKVISTNEIDEIIDIKNQLKKVDTDERSLLTHLKKEQCTFDNISTINTNIITENTNLSINKKKKKKKIKVNIDLEKEFNELVSNNS